MIILGSILFFFFGASIGSFVQVVSTRLYIAPIMNARSKCLSCGEALRVYDLFPVLSYLFLGGKCRYCKSYYGISALIIELIYGSVFVLLAHLFLLGQTSVIAAFVWFVYYTLLFITLGVIALYDKEHSCIPTGYLIGYILLTMAMFVKNYINDPSLVTLTTPLIISLPFLILWVISRKNLGFGDIVMFFGVGAFFGLAQSIAVFLISIWTGAIFGIIVYFLTPKNERKNMTIPFVPFIVFAFFFVLFTDINIFSIASLFA